MTRLLARPFPIALTTLVFLMLSACNTVADELTLAVANSTCNAIKEVGKLYQQQHDDLALEYICKSSGRLAKGINGKSIDADIYISANKKWMDYMIEAGLVSPGQVISTWGNELVVATPSASTITDFSWQDLLSNKIDSILIGDPGTAPFGRYAKQSLVSTDQWKQVRHKIQTKKHITLLAETLSEASANSVGILFASNVGDTLRVIYAIPPSWHDPIRYYLAPLKKSPQPPHVLSFLNFIQSESARAIFQKAGFKIASP